MSFTAPAERLQTDRLTLEPLTVAHADEMVTVLADTEIYHFTGGEPPNLAQLRHRYAAQCAGSGNHDEQWHNWIVRQRSPDRAIGYVQATVDETETALAWTIGVRWQGSGYAKEAAGAMLLWLRQQRSQPVTAWIHPDHVGSQRVAEFLGLVRSDVVDDDGEQRWVAPARP